MTKYNTSALFLFCSLCQKIWLHIISKPNIFVIAGVFYEQNEPDVENSRRLLDSVNPVYRENCVSNPHPMYVSRFYIVIVIVRVREHKLAGNHTSNLLLI